MKTAVLSACQKTICSENTRHRLGVAQFTGKGHFYGFFKRQPFQLEKLTFIQALFPDLYVGC